MEGGRHSVLDDDQGAEVFGDESGESCEILEDGAWVSGVVR